LARAFARHALSIPYHLKLHGTRRVQVRQATRRRAVSIPGRHLHRKVKTAHKADVVYVEPGGAVKIELCQSNRWGRVSAGAFYR